MSANPIGAVGDVLKREVGGLPVIAWAGIVGGGVLLGKRLAGGGGLMSRAATGTATPFTDPNLTGYTATGEPATDGTTGVTSGPADNAAWRRAALDFLVSVGVPPTTAELAITRWLSGAKLTTAEQAIVNTAVRQLGSPPEGVPLPVDDTPTPTNPTGTPRSPRRTTVKAPYGLGENLDQIAARIRRPVLLGGEGVTTTSDGRPLTASYLASVNGLNVRTDRALTPGTPIVY